MNQLVLNLILWYKSNKRILFFREFYDPYKIWLSEIIFQQTQIEQGSAYLIKFLDEFPTIYDLANSDDDKVFNLWQGLGYYSRARNILITAREIVKNQNGQFPEKYENLIKLKGIGNYTASAILSFAFNQKYPVLDGNVYRVLSRIFEINSPIQTNSTQKEFLKILNEMIAFANPKDFNNAMMDLGSMICKPHSPQCENCPINIYCESFKNKTQSNYPIKLKKNEKSELNIAYLVFDNANHFYLLKRPKTGIWAELYEFPNISSNKKININEIKDHIKVNYTKQFNLELIYSVNHLLTHKQIKADFYIIKPNGKLNFNSHNFTKMKKNEKKIIGVHKIIEKFMLYLYQISA